MLSITLSAPGTFAAVGELWLALQARAACSFFQSWTWVGCLAERRFPDPVLLQAHDGGRLVALALFNRRRAPAGPDTLWLGASGLPALDAVFVEHNGVLTEAGQGHAIASCLQAALRAPIGGRAPRFGRRLVLGGVDAAHLHAAAQCPGMVLHAHIARPAPFVDLARIRAGGTDYLGSLSANARYQIRRSARRYTAAGPLAVRRAATLAEAHDFLDALAALHQITWTGRGRPGAFANPDFVAFHRALIERAMPAGEVDLLRVSAGGRVVGYLYNFRFRDRAYAYQSGFDYAVSDPHQKPGLTCHHLAIEMYAAEGMDRYDFLAGGDRYKTSLANAETMLHWAELSPWWSARALLAAARDLSLRWRRTGPPAPAAARSD
ncbi:GNAT family N-acetyltransferase [Limobrevibacterium gyesilva]|uniref:GNAT family N-acetyltransferase n=1 Tax=Limobrevibacterium gyesilva TaxID=2991712 RepID=A0AA42CFP6_9PROT|nr:GNAT family N-acetyltransferase [Limobrevibacterium gyesilva]MCW3476884.1 GNAT family N-acetyltransferase [Limobrevibacterium gyesilva]